MQFAIVVEERNPIPSKRTNINIKAAAAAFLLSCVCVTR